MVVGVETGCRLHFGLLTGAGTRCGRHAGLGLMLARPGCSLTASAADADRVVADDPETTRRVERFVDDYRRHVAVPHRPPPCRLDIHATVPAHAGLGSGTQLGLAVALAMAALTGDEQPDPYRLAERVGRGRRSAIGTAGVRHGGLLVDSGENRGLGTRVVAHPVPADWRVVLATPTDATGVSGAAELRAFDKLARTSVAETDGLWSLVTECIVSALRDGDFARFAAALYDYGCGVGATFASVQGGLFATPATARLVAELRRRGVAGVGQTSWGPTVFALVPDAVTAREIAADLPTFVPDMPLHVTVTPVRADGARVTRAAKP